MCFETSPQKFRQRGSHNKFIVLGLGIVRGAHPDRLFPHSSCVFACPLIRFIYQKLSHSFLLFVFQLRRYGRLQLERVCVHTWLLANLSLSAGVVCLAASSSRLLSSRIHNFLTVSGLLLSPDDLLPLKRLFCEEIK